MKTAAAGARVAAVGLAVLGLAAGMHAADYPAWWGERGVVGGGSGSTNDYAAINQGQLKWFASSACDELEATLPGGAGTAVWGVVGSFSLDNNYAAVNLGQLKTVAQPFYDRLIEVGLTNAYPWTGAAETNDYAPANVGQVKHLFGFDSRQFDLDRDGLPDAWELRYGVTVEVSSIKLVALYRLDETAGHEVSDSGGHGLDGVITNCPVPQWRSGMIHGALGFDGTNGVVVPDDPLLDITTNITLAAYVWLDRLDGDRPLISKAPGYGLGTLEGAPLLTWSPSMSCAAAAPLRTGAWMHVAATYNGTSVAFYVDGACVDASNRTGLGEANTNALGLGWNAGGEPTGLLNGRLDDVRVYGRALASNEVASLAFLVMDSDGDGVANSDEVLYWTDPTNAASHPHAIFGSVGYTGEQSGAVVVRAATNADFWRPVAGATLAAPGAYELDNLPADTTWWVNAFRDSNTNGARDPDEAWGAWAGNPTQVLAYARNVDIQMTDPDLDEDALPDWWERVHPTVSITGVVAYAGQQAGLITVGVLADTGTGTPAEVTTTIGEPGPYVLSGLPRHASDGQYVLWAFQDSSSNTVCDGWEATGRVVLVPDHAIATTTNVDITLADPDTDSDGMPDWWETFVGFDPQLSDDALDDPDGDRYPNVYEYRHGTDLWDGGSRPPSTAVVTNGVDTIQGVLDAVTSDYAVVVVQPGVYPEHDLTFSGKRLLLVAEAGAGDAIVDAGGTGTGFIFTNGESQASVVCGLTISNGLGGGVAIGGSGATFRDCLIRNNVGQGDYTAGGVSCRDAGTVRFANCAFIANQGSEAGAAHAEGTNPVIFVNCTFAGNAADPETGYAIHGDTVALRNCVVWANNPSLVSASSIEYSDIEGGAAGTGNIDQDPLLVRGGWRLRSGSPCTDAGVNHPAAPYDRDGEVRSTPPDMGVDEVVDADADGMGDAWELQQGFDPQLPEDALDDPDGDRYPNVYEYVHGSSPWDSGSRPQPTVVVTNGVDTIQGAISGVAGDYAIVLVQPGIYHEHDVSFAGKRLLLVAEAGAGEAIIDADAAGAGLIFGSGETPASVACGLTVRNGSSGAIVVSSSGATVRDCVIRRNAAVGGYAGGVSCFSAGTVRFVNCGIIANHGEQGVGAGAVYADAGSAVFVNCTIAANLAPSWGAAVWGATVQMRNCIVWSNSPCALWIPSVEWSDVEGGTVEYGNIVQEPLLVRNGWRLRTGSPCLDAGTNSAASTCDLEAEPRSVPPDMGADEFIDVDLDGMGDGWELQVFGNLDSVGGDDADVDGLSNLYEYENGLCPTNSDTDGDGFADPLEGEWRSDPDDPQSVPHVVMGTVSYAGSLTGPIVVLAVADPESWDTNASVTLPEPGAYVIIGIPPFTNCTIKAFRDTNENGLRDDGEAYGLWPGNPTQPIPVTTDVDFALTDADDDADGMADWWEIAQGFNCHDATDALEDQDGDRYPNVYEYAHGSSPWDGGSRPEATVVVTNGVDTIQGAIESVASDYAIIRVEPGVYHEHDVSLAGKRLLLVAEAGAGEAIIDADAAGAGLLFGSGETPATVVVGITIRHATGGGIGVWSSSGTFRDCVIRNSGQGEWPAGGASFFNSGTLRFVNCALVGNEGYYAGAVYAEAATAVFANCTFAENVAPVGGAVMWGATVQMRNCIVWSNSPSLVYAASIEYSDIEGGASGTGNISADPLLARKDWRLRLGSPCVDAGAYSDAAPYDLDAEPRSSPWDMGADEFVDTEPDGMADAWELQAFGDLDAVGGDDADADGLSNLYEYENGLSPTNSDTDGDGFEDGLECRWQSDPAVPESVPHVIMGTVSYSGPQTGPIVVLAVVDPESWETNASVTIMEPGTYTNIGIPPYTNCTVKAFRDSNTNGIRDDGEAYGSWSGNPTAPVPVTTNVDLALTDPDEDADGMIDWWEVAQELDCHDPADAVGDHDGDRVPNIYEYKHGTNPRNCGSRPQPTMVVTNGVSTIQQALDVVTDDYAIVLVQPGVYQESFVDPLGGRLLLMAEPGAGDVIIDAGAAGPVFMVYGHESPASVVCGLTIQNGSYGGVWIGDSSPTFRDCVIRDNVWGSSWYGGGVTCIGHSTSRFVNCVFENNQAEDEGALHVMSPASALLDHCTVVGNTATAPNGAAIRGSSVELRNCIVWSNDSPYSLAEVTLVEWSDVEGGAPGLANTNVNPLLVSGWRLRASSPCINRGTNCASSLCDVDAEPRSSPPDMGADEFVDADQDGMADAWELQVFGGYGHSATNDTDSDGLLDPAEYDNDCSPTNSDTDGDGVSDYWEVVGGTNPRLPGDSELDAWLDRMDGEAATIVLKNTYGFQHRYVVDGVTTQTLFPGTPSIQVSGDVGVTYTMRVTRLGGNTTNSVDVSWRLWKECRASLLFRRSPPQPSVTLVPLEFGSINVGLSGIRTNWDRLYITGDVGDFGRWELPDTTLLRLEVPGGNPIDYTLSGEDGQCRDITSDVAWRTNAVFKAIDEPGGLAGFTNDIYLIRWEPELKLVSP